MKATAVTAEWSTTSFGHSGWVLCFSGGSFDGVPLSPAPEWAHAAQDLDEESIRNMIQATASWEGIRIASDFAVIVRRSEG
jgi:hypothetical protein